MHEPYLQRLRSTRTLAIASFFLTLASTAPVQAAGPQASKQASTTVASTPGTPFSAEQISSLLPATVYFQGRSAPLQLRNASAVSFAGGAIAWAALVDTSGYATSVQEKYQFYLVTEGPLRVGEASVPAGAYGGGFVGDRFILMDIGGHTLAQGPIHMDSDLKRPRPLQLVPDSATAVKLYLGRQWISLRAAANARP